MPIGNAQLDAVLASLQVAQGGEGGGHRGLGAHRAEAAAVLETGDVVLRQPDVAALLP